MWALQITQSAFDTRINGKCAQQAQKWLRQSNSLFRPTPDMFPGDEDNGSVRRAAVYACACWAPAYTCEARLLTSSPLA